MVNHCVSKGQCLKWTYATFENSPVTKLKQENCVKFQRDHLLNDKMLAIFIFVKFMNLFYSHYQLRFMTGKCRRRKSLIF